MKKAPSKRKHTSLENALRALKSFSEEEPELGVSELAEKLGLALSTTHRLLATLAEEDFVVKNPATNKYTIGLSVLQLTNTVTEQIKIIKESYPILKQLTEDTGESSHVGILDGSQVIYLQKVDGIYPVKLDSYLGKRNPIHCTSSGQIILAFQPDHIVEEILQPPLPTYTPFTLTNKHDIYEKLKKARQMGVVTSDQEFRHNIYSIGAPIYKDSRHVVASINIAGPVKRILPHKKYCIEKVLRASKELSTIIQRRS
ncbi:transcriptional regulator, IclR family [Alteribacillus persepolensis]|uniref:Glycerol operon regulatory protein n=1 Tax=Alteribacillus persepolensis TaxID=568899 RepID=A0A1G8A9E6_9BACI|nr:IclR family transcriptional regulator [Alteribacillus persepolensis]SDH17456.1 transcriptional regulator, IclR family [Alteribacillus persepolensis]